MAKKKMTKLEVNQKYYARKGFSLVRSADGFTLIATKTLGGIKPGMKVTSAKTLMTFDRMRQRGFLGR